jgi:hypothetical protein
VVEVEALTAVLPQKVLVELVVEETEVMVDQVNLQEQTVRQIQVVALVEVLVRPQHLVVQVVKVLL